MSIVQVEFGYGLSDTLAKLSEEDYQRVREILSLCNLPETREEGKEHRLYVGDTLIDMATDGPALLSLGLQFKAKKFKGNMWVNGGAPTPANPRAVHVHVPNIGLLSIDEVTWLEDCCTQELQGRLDEGWRILAVCPPNNQRRPDYILGRVREST